MRILAHWRMGVPYDYTHMGRPSLAWPDHFFPPPQRKTEKSGLATQD